MPALIGELLLALEKTCGEALLRELSARERQSAVPGDLGTILAVKVALLDRPAFASLFDTTSASRSFSLDAIAHHLLQVRIDRPAHEHEDACRIRGLRDIRELPQEDDE
ncbi:hypothetical protein ACWC0C_45890 [Streptomyces sp. NPDC001709]